MIAFMIVHTAIARRVLEGGVERSVASGAAEGGAHASRSGVLTRAAPALLLPVVVLGGIYSGLFTPTEAAGIAAIYALVATIAARLGMAEINGMFFRAAVGSAAIMFVIGFTSIFNRAMVLEQIPQAIAGFASTSISDPILFLHAVNLALLIVGMFMATSAATLLMDRCSPPAAAQFGMIQSISGSFWS